MQKYLSVDEAALFLRNARMGGIVTPDQLRSELRHVKQRPAIGRYAVGASVPNWLVERLDPTKPLAHNYTVYPTLDRLDTVLLATMQCANVQLRCVMQLSDPLTKAFLQDALEQKGFTLLFSIENTRQCAVMSVPMEFDEPGTLLGLIQTATRSSAGIAPAMQLTSFSCKPAFGKSLVKGQHVDDVIAVLATTPTAADLEMAACLSSGIATERRDSTLH
jgi:hypothetical protein